MTSEPACAAGVTSHDERCGTPQGYRAGCRCLGCRFAIREYNRKYRDQNPATVRAAARRRELASDYGITPEQFHAMKRAQGWRCAICRKRFPAVGGGKLVHVDHDHATGRVRGILCASCNAGLGRFGDSIEGLRRAIAYLEEFQLRSVSSLLAGSTPFSSEEP